MRNIELYRTIEALVEAKKEQFSPAQPTFAHEYCKKQIEKKKLTPVNPKSKMCNLLKKFNQLDTYVDVEQLFEKIDRKNMEKFKNEEKQAILKMANESNQDPIIINDLESLGSIREKLGPYNERMFRNENKDIRDIVEFLQLDSRVASEKRRNSPSSNDAIFFQTNTKKHEQREKFIPQKKWKHYEGSSYILDNENQKQNILHMSKQKKEEFKENMKRRKDKVNLMHQVTSYLQIILENHHQKKWGYTKFRGCEVHMQKRLCSRDSRYNNGNHNGNNLKDEQRKESSLNKKEEWISEIKFCENKNIQCEGKYGQLGAKLGQSQSKYIQSKIVQSEGRFQEDENKEGIECWKQTKDDKDIKSSEFTVQTKQQKSFKQTHPRKNFSRTPSHFRATSSTRNPSSSQIPSSIRNHSSTRNNNRRTHQLAQYSRTARQSLKTSPDSAFTSPCKKSTHATHFSNSNFEQVPVYNTVNVNVGVQRPELIENFTFRNRNIKATVLKKMNQFLEEIQSEELEFKKNNNISIGQLNELEKKEHFDIEKTNKFEFDDQELKAVKNIVMMQR